MFNCCPVVTCTFALFGYAGMPSSCFVCGHVKGKGKIVSMHQLPADLKRRELWLKALQLTESDATQYSRICSHRFLNGDPSQVDIGKRFASPRKKDTERSKRARSSV